MHEFPDMTWWNEIFLQKPKPIKKNSDKPKFRGILKSIWPVSPLQTCQGEENLGKTEKLTQNRRDWVDKMTKNNVF